MGQRYIVGTAEVELVDAEGNGYLVEVGGKYIYDTDVLEIEYIYNLETATYLKETQLTYKERNDIADLFCRKGSYFEGDDGDSAYELSMDK